MVKLTPGGIMSLQGGTFLPPTGIASFILDRAKVLQYRYTIIRFFIQDLHRFYVDQVAIIVEIFS